MKRRIEGKAIFLFLALYFIGNLLFLGQFPFMHSDESWLSGLSQAMLQEGLNTAEPFFDLKPSYPNAISILFHILQMPFLLIFGHSLFAVRLVSLLFGTALLFIFYRFALHLSGSATKSLVVTAILSVDIQFVYAAHFARQDIVIAFGLVATLYYIHRHADEWSFQRSLRTGLLIGIFAGVHPNALMIATSAGALFLYHIFCKRFKLTDLLTLIVTAACFAGLYIAVSLLFDKDFFTHYFNYGATLGVDQSFMDKLRNLPNYFLKLFCGVSGTYYTPPIQLQMIVFALGFIAACAYSFRRRETLNLLLPLLGTAAAIVLIGRYSQPAIVILFPQFYLLVFTLFTRAGKKAERTGALLLGGAVLVLSVFAVVPHFKTDYPAYLKGIEAVVPKESKVLANLNSAYAFDCGDLLDYRNLEYLQGMPFEEYIRSRGISYIIYPEEMDFIYESRPVWNILYGNLYPYYADLTRFLENSCTQVGAFTSPYAMRIAEYMDAQEWTVKIYRVKGED
jgi:4-amino-4-deoxy-L-arabinose transferase-like glycosyltransferase